ncbi:MULTISPECIES: hypothetical protein [Enterobacterales]|uniref:hypothetical protein n=1 Tax=Enterobacterales TaxID=91347 RepID=UPI0013DE589E|nr:MULTISPECIES: hypothetical protein [Enterobacterales]
MKLDHAVLAALEAVPEMSSYPSADQMVRNTQLACQLYPDIVTGVQLGVSAQG